MNGAEIRARSVATMTRVVHCPCYGGIWRVPGPGVGRCPGDDCPTHPENRGTSPVLLVREDGGYEVTLPGWGHVGEVTRYGTIESLPEPEVSSRSRRAVEEIAADIFARRPRERERQAGYHFCHRIATRLARVAQVMA